MAMEVLADEIGKMQQMRVEDAAQSRVEFEGDY